MISWISCSDSHIGLTVKKAPILALTKPIYLQTLEIYFQCAKETKLCSKKSQMELDRSTERLPVSFSLNKQEKAESSSSSDSMILMFSCCHIIHSLLTIKCFINVHASFCQ